MGDEINSMRFCIIASFSMEMHRNGEKKCEVFYFPIFLNPVTDNGPIV